MKNIKIIINNEIKNNSIIFINFTRCFFLFKYNQRFPILEKKEPVSINKDKVVNWEGNCRGA